LSVSALTAELANQALTIIRRANMVKGQHLTEAMLAQHLGVSRSPVRKAMQCLASEGVLSSVPNKGFQLERSAAELGTVEFAVPDTEEQKIVQIAQAHMNGELPKEIHENELMAYLHGTRAQVQKWLSAMARDGMVERKPGRGWVFKDVLTDKKSHLDSYRFRMTIEPAAVLEPGYETPRAALLQCRKTQEQLLEAGIAHCSAKLLFSSGTELHETIVAGANNRFMLDSLKNLNQMRRVLEYGTRLDQPRLEQQCSEHLVLIDLLLANERMEAAHYLREHLNRARVNKVEKT
jgi:DNA-binding GntR family transcriptional regulator